MFKSKGIFYKKNEVYIDVIESVNVLMSVKGTILRADVAGLVSVKAHLTGMPVIIISQLLILIKKKISLKNEEKLFFFLL